MEMAIVALAALLGFLSWGLVEYAVHGVLSHRLKTFVSPLHWGHHRDPRAVFTAPLAVAPATLLVLALACWLLGAAAGIAFTAGLFAGFVRYERVHFRIHFREPRGERERILRAHHLAHHFVNPRAYHGVTTRRWDRAFGTLPASFERDYERGADRPPLEGESNLLSIWNPIHAIARARAARHANPER